jgi:hypothetical protein
MADTLTDTISAAQATLDKLSAAYSNAQADEAKAQAALDAAKKITSDATAALVQARTNEQRAVASLGQASNIRAEWARKVSNVKDQIDRINSEIRTLATITQTATQQ